MDSFRRMLALDSEDPEGTWGSMIALAVLLSVPSCVLLLYFLIQFSQTVGTLRQAIESPWLSMGYTLLFSLGLIGLLWALSTLQSFWHRFIQERFSLSRIWSSILLVPVLFLGPFYYFGFTGVIAFKLKSRRGLLLSLPGFLSGYGLLMIIDKTLLGEYTPTWEHAILPTVMLGASFASGVLIVKELTKCEITPRKWTILGIILAPWIIFQLYFLIDGANAEQRMFTAEEQVSSWLGRPLTRTALEEGFKDIPITTDGLFHQLVKPKTEEQQPGEQQTEEQQEAIPVSPTPPSAALLASIERGDAEAQEDFKIWYSEAAKHFDAMDRATAGSLYKGTPEESDDAEELSRRIFQNLVSWSAIYKGRLLHDIQNRNLDDALLCLNRLAWIRDTAFADPFTLSYGQAAYFELMRLGCYVPILEAELLDDSQLAKIDQALSDELGKWNDVTKKTLWSSTAWYYSQVQVSGNQLVTMQSAPVAVLMGLLGPIKLWLIRKDGCWTLEYLKALTDKPTNDKSTLDAYRAIHDSIPTYVTYSKGLLPVWHVYMPAIAKQQALRCAIAIQRFRLKSQGITPEYLQKLVPEFLGEIPLDPFTGEQLIYRKDDFFETKPDYQEFEKTTHNLVKGFQVYSVMGDLTDNQGKLFDTNGQGDMGIAVRVKTTEK